MRRWAGALVLLCALAACQEGSAPMSSATNVPNFVIREATPRRPTAGHLPPLLVLLHGIGADEEDLFGLAPALDSRLHIVSLRAPRRYGPGYSWFDIAFGAGGQVTPNLEQARSALADVIAWLRAAPARFHTDPRRTFVLGFSQGAMMTLGTLQAAPDLLAGAIILSGRFPGDAFGSNADPNAADAMAKVPVFIGHGTQDDVLPIDNGRKVRDALTSRVRDVTYKEYPVGHGIDQRELHDIVEWLAARLGN